MMLRDTANPPHLLQGPNPDRTLTFVRLQSLQIPLPYRTLQLLQMLPTQWQTDVYMLFLAE